MRASRSSSSPGRPRRYILLRLILILFVALWAVYVLPSPWAYHMGGKFSPLGEWDGYGLVRASNGGRYLLFTHLRGGIVINRGHTSCSLTGCDRLTGSAQLCTTGGQHYTFALTGAVHGWYTTNGSRTDIGLTGGTPTALPHGTVVAFHGVWKGPVLPLASTGNSFTEAFTPSGGIRKTASGANGGTALVELRNGSEASFQQACRALATGH
jgi:hypothetical protein